MNLNPISCHFCGKEYSIRKKVNYDRHLILCELIANGNKNADIEEDDVPSLLQMYKIIRELSIQNKHLQEKVADLEKRGGGIKKVNVLERISMIKPYQTYHEWISTFDITEEDIEQIVTEPVTNVICDILTRNIEIGTDVKPIISNQDAKKQSIIYIYSILSDTIPICSPSSSPESYPMVLSNVPQWGKLEPSDFMRLMTMIYKTMMSVLQTKWRETNLKRFNFDEIYMKLVKKITAINLETHTDTNNRKIWGHLYSRCAQTL